MEEHLHIQSLPLLFEFYLNYLRLFIVVGTIIQYFLLNIFEEERIHSMDALVDLLLQSVHGKQDNGQEMRESNEEREEEEETKRQVFFISNQLQHIFENGSHLIEALCLFLKNVIINQEKEENALILRRLKAVFLCENRKDQLLTLSQPASLVWIELLAHLLSLLEEEEIFEMACNRIHLTESAKHRILEKNKKKQKQEGDRLIPWFHQQTTADRDESEEDDRVLNPSLEMKVEELIACLLHHIMNDCSSSSADSERKKKSRKPLTKEEQEQELQQLGSLPLDLFLRWSIGMSLDGLMKKRNEKILKQQQASSSSLSSATRKKSISSSSSAASGNSSDDEIEKLRKELAESSLRNKELQRRVQQLDNKIEYFLHSKQAEES
jgi:hypothetical protein